MPEYTFPYDSFLTLNGFDDQKMLLNNSKRNVEEFDIYNVPKVSKFSDFNSSFPNFSSNSLQCDSIHQNLELINIPMPITEDELIDYIELSKLLFNIE
ncbi:hypothetical protein AYI69_g7818 [Smittium culicis]|uniref:Uncharacterized protein n=1 Tax=Smittium culicis TaxID=133412 RepID=A0A1R1XPH7_9FUNG|nr:hypothetical protein AYI69_g7818 [Smittium culicis]